MKTGNRARNLVRAGKGFHGDLSTRVGAHGAACLLPQICLLLPPAILPFRTRQDNNVKIRKLIA